MKSETFKMSVVMVLFEGGLLALLYMVANVTGLMSWQDMVKFCGMFGAWTVANLLVWVAISSDSSSGDDDGGDKPEPKPDPEPVLQQRMKNHRWN